jgi:hypothetical protein
MVAPVCVSRCDVEMRQITNLVAGLGLNVATRTGDLDWYEF